MAMNPYFQAGIQMSQQAMEREDGRADRELRTQMNRLKANDIIKGMEVDAEVKNFFDYAKKNAKTLDKAHPGYASQLMGIANTGMSDLSPAAYEKAVPMVRQFYDRFDARKQIEAENDQRALATDYRARFGEDPTGISFPDAKFALEAKNNLNVDPVFAEKDGIRIFDRKATQAAVEVEQAMRAKSAGKLAGEAKLAQDKVGDPRLRDKATDDAATAAALEASQNNLKINREAALYELTEKRKISESETRFADTFNNEFSGATFAAPKSHLDRQALLEYKVALPGEEMPMAGASPNYPEMRKLITAKVNADKVAFEKAMTAVKGDSGKESLKETNTMRNEFLSLTKDYRIVKTAYANIQSAAKADNGAGDMSMLYSYVKLLDPNSVVRESEFAAAATSGSFGDRMQGAVSRVLSGARLTKDLRNSFLQEAKNLHDNQLNAHDKIAAQYVTLAKGYGLDPDKVVTRFSDGEIPEFQNEKELEVWKATPKGRAYGGSVIVGGKRYNPKPTGTTGSAPASPNPQGVPPATPRAALPTQDQRRAGQIEQVRKDIEELKSKVTPPGVRDWDGKRPALLAQIKAQENLLSDLLSK